MLLFVVPAFADSCLFSAAPPSTRELRAVAPVSRLKRCPDGGFATNTDKNGKATVPVCQSRDAALKSARGLRQHFCVVHYISGPNGARIELRDLLEWCSQQTRNAG